MVRFWGFCSATDRSRRHTIGLLLMRSRRGGLLVAFRIRRLSGLCFGLRSLWWRERSRTAAFGFWLLALESHASGSQLECRWIFDLKKLKVRSQKLRAFPHRDSHHFESPIQQ